MSPEPMPAEFAPNAIAMSERDEGDVSSADEAKLKKKELKRLYDSTRCLDGWERYRALVDAADEAYEIIDISNREARFALIVMGVLNAIPLVFLTRLDAVKALTTVERDWLLGLFVSYVALALLFLLQAIEALHPGRFRPRLESWPAGSDDFPAGVRTFEEVITRSAADHWTVWREVRLSQLNAELAVQVHCLALKNNAKHLALRRLYFGLRAMTVVLTALIFLFVVFLWT